MPLFCSHVHITRPPPPPPDPGVPEDELPPESPKPAAVEVKFNPKDLSLLIKFHLIY